MIKDSRGNELKVGDIVAKAYNRGSRGTAAPGILYGVVTKFSGKSTVHLVELEDGDTWRTRKPDVSLIRLYDKSSGPVQLMRVLPLLTTEELYTLYETWGTLEEEGKL